MTAPVLSIEGLSKRYRLGLIGTNTLQGDIQAWWYRMRGRENELLKVGERNTLEQAGGDYVWALEDINLTVNRGDVLGVVGKNGAGKSTLLKVLSRVTAPTTGRIRVKGRIGSLLEVGTGFHPELTGRDNIYLNGAILGMKRAEIRAKFDQIVQFSGIEKYVDTPVKRYSSGMYVRLAFAVAAHMEPEILVVDEVLAVGDIEFQKRAIGKMQDVSEKDGRTVLFVSHNMRSVQKLCTRAVFMDSGRLSYDGSVDGAIDHYFNRVISSSAQFQCEPRPDLSAHVLEVQIQDLEGEPTSEIQMGAPFRIVVDYQLSRPMNHFIVGVGLKQLAGAAVSTTWTPAANLEPGHYRAVFSETQLQLGPGTYQVAVGLSNNQSNIQYLDEFYFSVSETNKHHETFDNHVATHCAVLNQMSVTTDVVSKKP